VLLKCWTRSPPQTPKEECSPAFSPPSTEPTVGSNAEQTALPVPTPQTSPAPAEESPSVDDQAAPYIQPAPFNNETAAPVQSPQRQSITVTTQSKVETTVTQETTTTSAIVQPVPDPTPELVLPPIQILPSVTPATLEIRSTVSSSLKKEAEVSVKEVETVQPRILCVDDNPINLKVLQAYLKKLQKKNVKFAENGLEAFKAVEGSGEPFDLIFMGMFLSHRLIV
jgi:hypothetical protein